MVLYLKHLSGVLFYLLGGSFFVAYMLQYNEVTTSAGWWMQIADLPLILVGLLYGGTSLYLSVKPRNGDSKVLFVVIGIPLALIFATLITMNFWPLLTS